MNTKLENFPRNKLWYAICSSSLVMTWLLMSSVVQASDLQIYAKPESGQTTVILMLDNSGSMNSTYSGEGSQTRLARLKSGVSDLLTRDTVTLTDGTVVDLRNAYVGLGVFADSASRYDGQIKVAAAKLGNASTLATSGSQRYKLQAAVNAMNGASWTPSANAMAEAAAYLLGTTTYWERTTYPIIKKERYRLIRKYDATSKSSSRVYTYTYTYSICSSWDNVDWSNKTQKCSSGSWLNQSVDSPVTESRPNADRNDPKWIKQPVIPTYNSSNPTSINNPSRGDNQTIIYSVNDDTQPYTINANTDRINSGTPAAKGGTRNPDILEDKTLSDLRVRYKSPLPDESVTCDGQGIYFLSDGLPNMTTTESVEPLIQTLLNDDTFTCPASDNDTPATSSDLPNPNGDGGNAKSNWNCMGALAKRLYAGGSNNPKGRSINTAFVGFGGAFGDMTADTDAARGAKYACKLGSKLTGDACSPDAANTTLKNPSEGFGNGGFYYVTTDVQVTQSIAKFIKDNQNTAVDPLTTGAISVPYDALNSNNLQEYGYLRALAPSPGSDKAIWTGNLKKYKVALIGANVGAFEGDSGGLVFDSAGKFRAGTKDYWNSNSVYNSTSYTDGGKIDLGGAYSKVPMPILGQTQLAAADGSVTRYAYAAANQIRNLFTDVSGVTGTGVSATLTKMSGSTSGTSLLKIPENPTTAPSNAAALATYVLGKFNSTGQTVLKDFPVDIKLKLLNFLGYNTGGATVLPTMLTTPDSPYLSMGGSIHSLPVQLTYSGTLDASGNLTNTREQSILYGSMEGGLHLVDASTGGEQMVFVPADILNNTMASKALVVGASATGEIPKHGLDGTWVADPTYNITSTTSGTITTTKVTARQMNIYGGMRMGGSSYYGLNVLTPTSPKLLFRIDSLTTGFSRLGQTWSKPVLANVRYNGVITRVMIVGGGYDQCYENPNFSLGASVSTTEYPDTSCNNKAQAQGNAVYMINAKTGALIWSATYDNAASDTDGTKHMKHSIVSRVSTLDRDADGLVDHLYFGDLGGQVFRADLNNKQTKIDSTYSNFGIRVVRLANLATGTDTSITPAISYSDSNAPRFYEPPTVTIHDQGASTFIVLGMASGDRSTPLDVAPDIGRDGMKPATALASRPINNVYGVIDRDFIKSNLITATGTLTLESINKVRTDFKKDPQKLTGSETVTGFFFPSTGAGAAGWYRSLSSTSDGTEKAIAAGSKTATTRTRGGLKAFEEPIAITNNLVVSVYDPEGTGVSSNAPCTPRVVGETDWQTYCLPFGVCLNANGTINRSKENKSGFKLDTAGKNLNIIGSGIRGTTFVPKPDTSGASNSCGALTMAGNSTGTGGWQCTSHLIQTRWYERFR